MNRFLTIVAMITLAASWAAAQITITARDVPRTPDQQFQYYSESGGIPINVGVPGGPQTWDFTTGGTANITTDLYLDPSTSPPQYSRANVVIQTDEINFSGINEPGKMYCYLHTLRFIMGALETTYEGQTVDFMLTPPVTQYTLPMVMGNTWSNTLNLDEIFTFSTGDIRIELFSTINSEVDAYGTAQVPYGDYEVLRVRNNVHYDLTVSIWLLFIWVPILQESGDAINYDWRAQDIGAVVTATGPDDPYFTSASQVRRLMNAGTISSNMSEDLASEIPKTEVLIDCYPNPFNNQTLITYQLTRPSEVVLGIYDILGRQVVSIDQGMQSDGLHEIHWSPENLSAGVYFAVLQTENHIQKQMLVYLK